MILVCVALHRLLRELRLVHNTTHERIFRLSRFVASSHVHLRRVFTRLHCSQIKITTREKVLCLCYAPTTYITHTQIVVLQNEHGQCI